MKKIVTLAMLFTVLITVAQKVKIQKLDKIIKRDYSVLEGTILKMSDKNIEFTLPDEKMVNTLEISKIARIEFASGRKQTFELSSPDNQENENTTVAKVQDIPILKNTIAVLPIPFVNSESLTSSEEMAKFAQSDMYSKLIEKVSNIFPLTVQDLRITNNLLRKAGIDYKNVDETPIEDIEKILGVDHIIASKVSYTIDISQEKMEYNHGEIKQSGNNTKVNDFDISNTNIEKKFKYKVYFDIYKMDSKIYTQNREPFLETKDSWMDSMQYLLKRCPIYTKD